MEDALIEVATMHHFAGIDLITDRIPDETTILAFRHLPEENDLGAQIFEAVKAHLKVNSMARKQGTIIDATLIAAPSSTKNEKGERSRDAPDQERQPVVYRDVAAGPRSGRSTSGWIARQV